MKISICIPIYNRFEYLKELIDSILKQTSSNYEIILGQDPTPDGPHLEIQNWSKDLAAKKEHVSYFCNEKNLGLAGNWNELVKKANGEYLILLGDDDKLHKSFVAELTNITTSNKPDVIFCNQYFIDEKSNINESLTKELNIQYKRNILHTGFIENNYEVIFNNSVPSSGSIIKTTLAKELLFKEELNTPELDFFVRCAIKESTFYYINMQLAYYRIHSGSITSSGLKIHKLVKNLIQYSLNEQGEVYKSIFIKNIIVPAINKALLDGEKEEAKFLMDSKYYIDISCKIKFIQQIASYMPTSLFSLIWKSRQK